ncbi:MULTISPECIES: DUF4297 domain-containing protein [Acinetobacter]|uniref:DUF4297 domain-containing protein n=1 Tax=Acinetobacter TaxID=469 RepID=UPI00066B7BD9|nr:MULTISPECIES: DUF4297 domain-containing protein [Acinetobacter]AYY52249.1 DUF4297 domain-containing protein [Acinetobacter baumannii]KMV26919.1 hypothetical protein AB987_2384 [Acinetobacter baumannii]MBH8252060.1 DUF4297 domain-containing protein [Acinetobacter baumannii]MDA3476627.1 DUF4297 domain-containing protein [Acinetobacter baumannii]MDA4882419.1 DUF4297 domain-containing protein [Acinetobacter baumannii]
MLDGNHSPQNPLAVPQRETAGANTFAKYEYQYHWALCRILDQHTKSQDYAVFIELHEDVVFSTSTELSKAEFEFNQIKNLTSKPLKAKNLIQRKKDKGKLKNSILGKMVIGVKDKPFFDQLKSLNLVATCGFDINLKNADLKLEVISLDDLHEDCVIELQNAVDIEVGKWPLPSILNLITPGLPDKCFQDVSIGKISSVVNIKKSGANHNPQLIYQVLIDELHRKGTVELDFTKWEDLISNKGLTGIKVEKTISQFTENNSLKQRETELSDILSELGILHHEKTKIKKAFNRYHTSTLQRNLAILQDQGILKEVINNNYSTYENEGLEFFLKISMDQLLKNDKITLKDVCDLNAGLLYELICKNEEF